MILLFKSWVLDTRIKFAIGCVGVIILGRDANYIKGNNNYGSVGIAIEGLLCLRREIQSRKILLRIRGVARRGKFL